MDNKLKEKIKNDKILSTILPLLKNYNTFLVGGFVRDLLLNKNSNDRDIVVFNESAEILSKKFQEKINGFFVELDAENQIYRIIAPNKIDYIDVAKGVGENIETDLKRRDFTINALAIDFKTLDLIDLTDGLKDLKEKKIKPISEKNLLDDALRIIRAPRFQATLGFDIDKTIFTFASKNTNLLDNIAKERINHELMKLFEGNFCVEGLLSLDKMNLLEKFFPEMTAVKKIPPNTHHHLPLFGHIMEVIRQITSRNTKETIEIQNYFEQKDLGAYKKLAYLKLAGFLHDVGKPLTWTIEPNTGRHRFIKHDDIGSQIIVKTLKNLKFSNKQIKYLQKMIKYHIYPSALMAEEVNEKALNRYFRKMEKESLDLIYLAMADRLSARGEAITEDIVKKNILHLENMTNFYFEKFINQKPLEKLLDGNEIMEILNIEKSPTLGKIINILKEAQINSEVVTKSDAIKFIKNIDLRNF